MPGAALRGLLELMRGAGVESLVLELYVMTPSEGVCTVRNGHELIQTR
jgi:hypothetical protein